ncbi:hypothetical protein K505DRAFT_324587 [Melanomma pulvis-pyrius CBS 109.77]|uniref:Uncharacterized protein n=1 Tax=Melanomma pulvis-pyrius CBS 109.77 TaxID=1314802 RepID=A0A6A6XEI5_9PLEO|nr:hypothetical protein K505DRAFT_324587 [Melanomma pulvis-pyrius CBS 109.77]
MLTLDFQPFPTLRWGVSRGVSPASRCLWIMFLGTTPSILAHDAPASHSRTTLRIPRHRHNRGDTTRKFAACRSFTAPRPASYNNKDCYNDTTASCCI